MATANTESAMADGSVRLDFKSVIEKEPTILEIALVLVRFDHSFLIACSLTGDLSS